MNKKLAIAALVLSTFSGFALADTQTTQPQTTSAAQQSQIEAVDNIARIGYTAMQDVQLSRLALFDGKLELAKKFLLEANRLVNDDKTDWDKFIQKNKKTPLYGDNYVIINSSLAISETFKADDARQKAIKEANDKLKNGDKKAALETLKLAGVTVVENQMLMPLKQTRDAIQEALKMYNAGQYYQANLMLQSVEQGIIIDTEAVSSD